jgi:uncharacterized phage protein (TIGR02220 family)
MKIILTKLPELLNDKLTLTERGLLITIILLRDADPKLTLAKVKAKVQLPKFKAELINLQNLGFIEWSGYKQAKSSLEDMSIKPQVIEVIDFMNVLYRQNNQYTSKSHYPALLERLKEYTVDEIKMVIANRYSVWKDDAVMKGNLRASTIFRPSKFDKYFEEAQRTKKGERFLEAKKGTLKDGDEITLKISQTLSDVENYFIAIHTLNPIGVRVFTQKTHKSGADIKRSLKISQNSIEHGEHKEFEYEYKVE